ncbi:MAG: methyl-accepting chemotaxis protein [Spirochaetia bacterium]|nr:methyl-accepting chemotaxis protein [Spirochaetia bacterium]
MTTVENLTNPSFQSFVIKRTTLFNIPLLAILFLYLQSTLMLSLKFSLYLLLIECGISLVFLTLIFPVINMFITNKLSGKIDYYLTCGLGEKDRNTLIQKLFEFPMRISLETFFSYFLITLILIAIFKYGFNIDKVFLFPCAINGALASYIAAVFMYSRMEKECSALRIKVTSEGFDSFKNWKKNYSRSLIFTFITNIIVPLALFAVSFLCIVYLSKVFVIIHSNGEIATFTLLHREKAGDFHREILMPKENLFRLLFTGGLNTVAFGFFLYIYFSQLIISNNEMKSSLLKINFQNVQNAELFQVDLNNEISYTMYLLNKTIIKFRQIMKKSTNISMDINQATSDLKTIAQITTKAISDQASAVEEISSTMSNTDFVSTKIGQRLDEVINVAAKTLEDVDKSLYKLNQNLLKMKEITDANKSTIFSIENLSEKIENISEIVNLIDSVAEQTKIIAFNAELEVNNINEDSLNFKNVANETRILADDAMSLTKHIKEEIYEIQKSSSDLIITSQSCMEKINQGNRLTDDLRDRFNLIKNSATITVEDSKAIKNAIQSQITDFRAIVDSMKEIGKTLRTFTTSTDNIFLTIDTLNKSSRHIIEMKDV